MTPALHTTRSSLHAALRPILIAISLVLASSVAANGQADQGTIAGTITDLSRAAVAHASVTLTNRDTGLAFSTDTGNTGSYVFSPLKVGQYDIRVTATGFSTVVRQKVTVTVQSRVQVDVTLSAGAVDQVIDVMA